MLAELLMLAALAQADPAPAEPPAEETIPNWGGAIRFQKASDKAELPYAVDAGWKGEKVCEPLFENEHIRTARCTFAPGVGHEKHWHPPHWGYIVSGATMRITDKTGTNDRVLPDGGMWWSDGVDWHEAVNIGETTGVYIIVEPKSAVKE